MKVYEIKSLIIPTKGTATGIGLFVNTFGLEPNGITIDWTLFQDISKEEDPVYDGILTGTTPISKQEYDLWGSDDEYIINLVCSKIGVERVGA